MTHQNGTNDAARREAAKMLANLNSVIGQRLRAAGQGYTHQGERDLYGTLGYLREIAFQDYVNKIRRGSIAGRGLNLPVEDTWKRKPVLIDGNARSDEQAPASEFLRQWIGLTNRLKLWAKLPRLDKLAGLGQYALLLLGTRDGDELDRPLVKRLRGPDDVLYARLYSEGTATITVWDEERNSPRYGLPLLYQVQTSANAGGVRTVHYSRVLHVAEGLLEDDVYGVPALEAVYNRLDDLEKVTGGSSEAFWLNIRKGLAILAREDVDLPNSADDRAAFDAEVDNYVHNLERVMRLQGVELQELGADVVSGYDQFKMLVSVIAADLDIPQRKLIGNEAGELASSQDERNWAAKIASRQADFAEPEILRALLDWLLSHGALAKPGSGSYGVEWPPVYEPTQEEAAQTALTVAQALSAFTGGAAEYAMSVEDYTERYLHYVPKTTARQVIEREEAGDE